MALAEKYVLLFKQECIELSKIVLDNLQMLAINPKNNVAREKMLQAADTIIGDSRFINHKELEQAAMLLVTTFNEKVDISRKLKEIKFFIEIFSKILNH